MSVFERGVRLAARTEVLERIRLRHRRCTVVPSMSPEK
jgi:hypothetical protein